MKSFGPSQATLNEDITVLDFSSTHESYNNIHIHNTSSSPGFFSVNNGACWIFLPASAAVTLQNIRVHGEVLLRQGANDSIPSGVHGVVW